MLAKIVKVRKVVFCALSVKVFNAFSSVDFKHYRAIFYTRKKLDLRPVDANLELLSVVQVDDICSARPVTVAVRSGCNFTKKRVLVLVIVRHFYQRRLVCYFLEYNVLLVILLKNH